MRHILYQELCTKALITGFKIPDIASAMATKFEVMESVRFSLIG